MRISDWSSDVCSSDLAGGTVGSQDWMKAALTAKAAGVDFRKMRFVAFEGGGEAVTALRGGHIQAYMGDAAEAFTMLEGGAPIRVLAVFNNERLPGKLNSVPKIGRAHV